VARYVSAFIIKHHERKESRLKKDTAWNSAQDTSNVLFAEYANTNAAGTRVSFAKKLTSSVGISTILSDYSSWVDANFIGVSAN